MATINHTPQIRRAMDVLTFLRTGNHQWLFTIHIRRAGRTVRMIDVGIN